MSKNSKVDKKSRNYYKFQDTVKTDNISYKNNNKRIISESPDFDKGRSHNRTLSPLLEISIETIIPKVKKVEFSKLYNRMINNTDKSKIKNEEKLKKIVEESYKVNQKGKETKRRSMNIYTRSLKDREQFEEKNKKALARVVEKQKIEEDSIIAQTKSKKVDPAEITNHIQNLYEWNKSKISKIEEIKANINEKNKIQLVFKPQINKNSRNLTPDARKTFEERLYTEDIIRRNRNKAKIYELSKAAFKPLINKSNVKKKIDFTPPKDPPLTDRGTKHEFVNLYENTSFKKRDEYKAMLKDDKINWLLRNKILKNKNKTNLN